MRVCTRWEGATAKQAKGTVLTTTHTRALATQSRERNVRLEKKKRRNREVEKGWRGQRPCDSVRRSASPARVRQRSRGEKVRASQPSRCLCVVDRRSPTTPFPVGTCKSGKVLRAWECREVRRVHEWGLSWRRARCSPRQLRRREENSSEGRRSVMVQVWARRSQGGGTGATCARAFLSDSLLDCTGVVTCSCSGAHRHRGEAGKGRRRHTGEGWRRKGKEATEPRVECVGATRQP